MLTFGLQMSYPYHMQSWFPVRFPLDVRVNQYPKVLVEQAQMTQVFRIPLEYMTLIHRGWNILSVLSAGLKLNANVLGWYLGRCYCGEYLALVCFKGY